MATGFRRYLPFRSERAVGTPPSEHLIVDHDDPHLAYVGFVRTSQGVATGPIAEQQAMWWNVRLSREVLTEHSAPFLGYHDAQVLSSLFMSHLGRSQRDGKQTRKARRS